MGHKWSQMVTPRVKGPNLRCLGAKKRWYLDDLFCTWNFNQYFWILTWDEAKGDESWSSKYHVWRPTVSRDGFPMIPMSSSRHTGGWCRGTKITMKESMQINWPRSGRKEVTAAGFQKPPSLGMAQDHWPPFWDCWDSEIPTMSKFHWNIHQVSSRCPRYPRYPMTWAIPKLLGKSLLRPLRLTKYHRCGKWPAAEEVTANCT